CLRKIIVVSHRNCPDRSGVIPPNIGCCLPRCFPPLAIKATLPPFPPVGMVLRALRGENDATHPWTDPSACPGPPLRAVASAAPPASAGGCAGHCRGIAQRGARRPCCDGWQ